MFINKEPVYESLREKLTNFNYLRKTQHRKNWHISFCVIFPLSFLFTCRFFAEVWNLSLFLSALHIKVCFSLSLCWGVLWLRIWRSLRVEVAPRLWSYFITHKKHKYIYIRVVYTVLIHIILFIIFRSSVNLRAFILYVYTYLFFFSSRLNSLFICYAGGRKYRDHVHNVSNGIWLCGGKKLKHGIANNRKVSIIWKKGIHKD